MPIHLNRLYTRSGDGGTTGLGDGSRVAKTSVRIAAMAAVDETNAVIGFAISLGEPPEGSVLRSLAGVQNRLFDLGAEICFPPGGLPDATRFPAEAVTDLERRIDAITAVLAPLTSFILPGGTPLAAALHQARTVCRRAEIELWRLAETESVSAAATGYLNRLSDLLFATARLANDGGRADVLWRPHAVDPTETEPRGGG